eukprot:1487140-Rhodomonas_salina.3
MLRGRKISREKEGGRGSSTHSDRGDPDFWFVTFWNVILKRKSDLLHRWLECQDSVTETGQVSGFEWISNFENELNSPTARSTGTNYARFGTNSSTATEVARDQYVQGDYDRITLYVLASL